MPFSNRSAKTIHGCRDRSVAGTLGRVKGPQSRPGVEERWPARAIRSVALFAIAFGATVSAFVVGMSVALGWPLSDPNLDDAVAMALPWGALPAIALAIMAALTHTRGELAALLAIAAAWALVVGTCFAAWVAAIASC